MSKVILRRSAELLDIHAKSVFASCEGIHGNAFCCNDCPAEGGRKECAADHAELVLHAKALRKMARKAKP